MKEQDKDIQKRQDEVDALAEQLGQLYKDNKHRTILLLMRVAEIVNQLLMQKLYSLKFGRTRRTRFSILDALVMHNGSMTSTNLSKSIFRTKHTVTRLVDRLKKDGLVKRNQVGGDRRLVKISITQEGIDFLKRTMADRQKFFNDITTEFSSQQLDELQGILEIFRKRLQNYTNK